MQFKGWRAYYSNDRRYSSKEYTWQGLPFEGLLGLVLFKEPPYRIILSGFDWCYLENGEFKTVDTHDVWGKWNPKPDIDCQSCIKKGEAVSDEEWERVSTIMTKDKEWL